MYTEHSDDFHEVSVFCKKKHPDDDLIELVKKHLIPYQKDYKPSIIVNIYIGEDEYGFKKKKVKTVKRNIRFDKGEKEFYIFYKCYKYWVEPVRIPCNEHDNAIMKWTVGKCASACSPGIPGLRS